MTASYRGYIEQGMLLKQSLLTHILMNFDEQDR
jgi:hypothetical protein